MAMAARAARTRHHTAAVIAELAAPRVPPHGCLSVVSRLHLGCISIAGALRRGRRGGRRRPQRRAPHRRGRRGRRAPRGRQPEPLHTPPTDPSVLRAAQCAADLVTSLLLTACARQVGAGYAATRPDEAGKAARFVGFAAPLTQRLQPPAPLTWRPQLPACDPCSVHRASHCIVRSVFGASREPLHCVRVRGCRWAMRCRPRAQPTRSWRPSARQSHAHDALRSRCAYRARCTTTQVATALCVPQVSAELALLEQQQKAQNLLDAQVATNPNPSPQP